MSTDFIYQQTLEDVSICDKLIDLWREANKQGRLAAGGFQTENGTIVDKDIKDSLDLFITGATRSPIVDEYLRQLWQVTIKYADKFPYCKHYAGWRMVEGINLQYYPPGGGFKIWHTERTGKNFPSSARHLVWMTYLNDVNDGGGTEFFHQNLTTPARKGSTLIWPVDWTYTHRGQVSPTEEKWVITGWYSFIN
jgi:hypothetical protein